MEECINSPAFSCDMDFTVGKRNYFTRKVPYFTTFIGCGQISTNIAIEMYSHRQEAREVGFRGP